STSLTPSSTLRTVNSQAPWATASPTRYDSSASAGCSAVSDRGPDDGATSARQPTATNRTTRSVAQPPHPNSVTLAHVDMPWHGGCDGGGWYGGCMRCSNRK